MGRAVWEELYGGAIREKLHWGSYIGEAIGEML